MSDDDDAPREPPRGLAVAGWGLVLFAGCRLLQIFLEAQATASAIGQAVLAEWGTSRLGVARTPVDRTPSTQNVARRAAVGVLTGFAIAGVLLGLLLLSRGATIASVEAVSVPVLAIGLVTACVNAWRDELILHGVPLRALGMFEKGDRPAPQDLFRIMACGVTSAGAAVGRSDASARSIVVALLLGIVFGALWTRDRGVWLPFGAHAAFRFALDTLAAGGLGQTRLATNAWAGGDAGIFAGTAAVVALAPLALAAMFVTIRGLSRGFSPDSSRVG